ncbi:hypothetical protein D3C78_1935890 [compost metagenome]
MVSDLDVARYLTKPLKIEALREAVMQISNLRYLRPKQGGNPDFARDTPCFGGGEG